MQSEPAPPESSFLNHAEDLALLLETLPHRLDLADGVLAWRPEPRRNVLAGTTDPRARQNLDAVATRLDRQASAAQDAVREAVRTGKLELLWPIASIAGKELRPVIEEARDAISCSAPQDEPDVDLARIA